MSEPEPAEAVDDGADSAQVLDEVRQAAGAVIASLKWFVEAAERVVEDPAAFSQVVDNGRSVVEAFVGGFVAEANPATQDESEPHTDGDDPGPES